MTFPDRVDGGRLRWLPGSIHAGCGAIWGGGTSPRVAELKARAYQSPCVRRPNAGGIYVIAGQVVDNAVLN
jgi:hypothetical protein